MKTGIFMADCQVFGRPAWASLGLALGDILCLELQKRLIDEAASGKWVEFPLWGNHPSKNRDNSTL